MKLIARKTLVVGAGLNARIYGNQCYLSSWGNFLEHFYLKTMSKNVPSSLAIEEKIRDLTLFSSEEHQALKWEKMILNEMKKEMSQNTKSICEDTFDWILKNPKISDIICLNFNPPFDLKWSDFHLLDKQKAVVKNKRAFRNNCEYYKLNEKFKCNIRFWFPHGVAKSTATMVFGSHRYCGQTSVISRLFSHLKKRETEIIDGDNKKISLQSKILEHPFSWLDSFIFNELYFLGCSLSHAEWDLWSALAFRRRNFAKKENRKHEQPIFHMRSGNQHDTSYPRFIQPLYDPSMSYDDQWKKLEQDFRKEINTQRSQSKKNNKSPI